MKDIRGVIADIGYAIGVDVLTGRNGFKEVIKLIHPLISMMFETTVINKITDKESIALIRSNVMLDYNNIEYMNIPLYTNIVELENSIDVIIRSYVVPVLGVDADKANTIVNLIDESIVIPAVNSIPDADINIYIFDINILDTGLLRVNNRGAIRSLRYNEYLENTDG